MNRISKHNAWLQEQWRVEGTMDTRLQRVIITISRHERDAMAMFLWVLYFVKETAEILLTKWHYMWDTTWKSLIGRGAQVRSWINEYWESPELGDGCTRFPAFLLSPECVKSLTAAEVHVCPDTCLDWVFGETEGSYQLLSKMSERWGDWCPSSCWKLMPWLFL